MSSQRPMLVSSQATLTARSVRSSGRSLVPSVEWPGQPNVTLIEPLVVALARRLAHERPDRAALLEDLIREFLASTD